jgi:malonate transporter and related proteins
MSSILNVVLPIFAIILTGYIAGRRGLLGETSSTALNGFVFYFALPVLLFKAMAQVDTATVLNGPYIATYMGGQVIALVVGMAVARGFFRTSWAEAATHGTVAIYGNVGYMGIPLVLAAFGEAALPPAIIATIINAALNISVLTAFIETGQHQGRGGRAVRDVAFALIKNPILIAPILGFMWSLSGLSLPAPVITYGDILGAAAGPCALFSLGLFLVGKPLSEGIAEVSSMTIIKLLVHPLATWGLAVFLLADQPRWFTICILMAALPTGANIFILVQRYNIYVARTSTAILASTVLSLLTLSALFIL